MSEDTFFIVGVIVVFSSVAVVTPPFVEVIWISFVVCGIVDADDVKGSYVVNCSVEEIWVGFEDRTVGNDLVSAVRSVLVRTVERCIGVFLCVITFVVGSIVFDTVETVLFESSVD